MARLKSPKSKGDDYERELAHYFNARLFGGREQVTRAPLSGGGRSWGVLKGGGSDLNGLPGLHIEAKRTEKLALHEAMAQAKKSVVSQGSGELPVVVSRRNRTATGDSIVALSLDDFSTLLGLAYAHLGHGVGREEPRRIEAREGGPAVIEGDYRPAGAHAEDGETG